MGISKASQAGIQSSVMLYPQGCRCHPVRAAKSAPRVRCQTSDEHVGYFLQARRQREPVALPFALQLGRSRRDIANRLI
jgi:hypothetical protein